MTRDQIQIGILREEDFDSLRPLVDEFIRTHKSLSFRTDYWEAFCDYLTRSQTAENILCLRAIIKDETVGFVIGVIQDNGPLIFPERVGYVSIMVVDKNYRSIGVGNTLWKELRNWFLTNRIDYFELYTEFGNTPASTFWKNRGFSIFLERRRQCFEKP